MTHLHSLHATTEHATIMLSRRVQGRTNRPEVYASQTKIWEGETKDEMRIFDALFKGVSTQFGPRAIEKTLENPHLIFCSSFPNLRLGGVQLDRKKRLFDAQIEYSLPREALRKDVPGD
jgi:hypothetical protein